MFVGSQALWVVLAALIRILALKKHQAPTLWIQETLCFSPEHEKINETTSFLETLQHTPFRLESLRSVRHYRFSIPLHLELTIVPFKCNQSAFSAGVPIRLLGLTWSPTQRYSRIHRRRRQHSRIFVYKFLKPNHWTGLRLGKTLVPGAPHQEILVNIEAIFFQDRPRIKKY